MNGFVKVSNDIFNYKLSPKALFVYIYLCSRVSCLQTTTVKLETISKACNMDVKTVSTAVSELEEKKLVVKQNRYNSRGYIASRYYVTNIINGSKSWFKIDREVFSTDIKATDFMVYCFVICKMSESDKQSFPSFTAIKEGTHISRGRVAKAVSYLRTYTFINRIKRHYRRTRAYRHNRYIHFLCNIAKKGKRKARTSQVRTNPHIKYAPKTIFIIHQMKIKSNTIWQI